MFEHHRSPLLPFGSFRYRVIKSILLGIFCLLLTISIGMIGFHHFEEISWLEAYLEASMIYGGMGTVFHIETWQGKVFGGTYAILCPFMLFTSISIFFLPLLHRFLHKFHLQQKETPKV